ncbi:MAG: hypothetical protein DI636_07960 [Pelagerythrobacter marensis]|nr:MAG: hypothetical protein DI636_07960 [Pelagerythrobacter marensis]PZU15317.1 MAG: hypothetical protein DI591_10575 [Citromicrobium sp.]
MLAEFFSLDRLPGSCSLVRLAIDLDPLDPVERLVRELPNILLGEVLVAPHWSYAVVDTDGGDHAMRYSTGTLLERHDRLAEVLAREAVLVSRACASLSREGFDMSGLADLSRTVRPHVRILVRQDWKDGPVRS